VPTKSCHMPFRLLVPSPGLENEYKSSCQLLVLLRSYLNEIETLVGQNKLQKCRVPRRSCHVPFRLLVPSPGLENEYKSSCQLLVLLESYLNESQFDTEFNGETSSRFHLNSGVPQGNILARSIKWPTDATLLVLISYIIIHSTWFERYPLIIRSSLYCTYSLQLSVTVGIF
jgi:hypothetical protein